MPDAALPLVSLRDLRLSLPAEDGGRMAPVDGVSFDLERGGCAGLVGESGCGKSLTALTLLGLTRELPGARITGEVAYTGADGAPRDLLRLSEHQLCRIRGRRIAMVFQDPLSALNPLMRVEQQIAEVLVGHLHLRGAKARARVAELLEQVGVPQAAARMQQYPHQLSGGLRQRVMLALALAGEPELLIADEPTTALDVTIQAQILSELRRLRARRGLSILFITHDLGVVAQLCDRVMVMYAGRIVEHAPVSAFFRAPRHPYSQGLLASLPAVQGGQERLTCIPGSPPRPDAFPPGCRFHPRCPLATAQCRSAYPPFFGPPEHAVACFEHVRAALTAGVAPHA